jgi:hypothetical protein
LAAILMTVHGLAEAGEGSRLGSETRLFRRAYDGDGKRE